MPFADVAPLLLATPCLAVCPSAFVATGLDSVSESPLPPPVAVAGGALGPDRALWLASLYHRYSGRGAGRTVWGMAETMGTGLTGVTWEMLDSVPHHPICVIRVED